MTPASTNLEQGFTLIELMVTVAVAAILLTVAVPSFNSTIKNSRLTTQANELITSLQLARSEAIKRNQRISLCKSSDGASCISGGNWEQGWLVFADLNTNSSVDSGEEILRVQKSLDGTTLRGQSDLANYISYVASGATQLTDGNIQQGSLVLCDERGVDNAKGINISATGHPRIASASELGLSGCTP